MSVLDLMPAIAPELEGDEHLETFVELAAGRLSAKVFGARYPEAVAYLAAHLLTMSKRVSENGVASGGAVASVSTGGLSLSFGQSNGQSSAADESLKSTHYGQEFLAIRATRAAVKGLLIR